MSDTQVQNYSNDLIWSRIMSLAHTDRNPVTVQILADEYALLDNDALGELQVEYARIFKAAPMLLRDSSRHRYFFGAANNFKQNTIIQLPSGESILVDTTKPMDPTLDLNGAVAVTQEDFPYIDGDGRVCFGTKEKIRRPPNAFILFRKDYHPQVKAENPGIRNNDISIIIGALWAVESAEVRGHYKKLAALKKREHLLKYPGYQYQPRKPSEKKRRMTKKKAATPAAARPEGPVLQVDNNWNVTAQLPVTQSLMNSVDEYNAVVISDPINSGPQMTAEAESRAFIEFIRTGIYDPENAQLVSYINKRLVDPSAAPDRTVIPDAHMINAERPGCDGWQD